MEQGAQYTLNPPRTRPTGAPEIVDYIISSAIRLKASDIHIGINQSVLAKEPYLLRFRVYGKLQLVKSDFLNGLYKEVIARIKILAEMSTTDSGVPQDGQVSVASPDGNVVLRVSTIPCLDQEEAVIRIQRSIEKNPTLDQLLMTKGMLGRLTNLIHQKSGMIILNGPAGSGKTTTIYSILGTLASAEKKVITAEDPIEMRLPYVSHMQVTHKTGFAELARTFMRQDADVIFIGEVRDAESAEIAVQLAQTGHLVLTTLHTRDSIGVVQRLATFNIHPSYIGSTLIGSLSQRLVPRICPSCRQEVSLPDATRSRLSRILPPGEGTKFYKTGAGCASCTAGVAGRLPIFELFVVDTEISDLISRNTPKSELLAVARTKGMTTLAEEALMRVYAGHTDLASVTSFIVGAEY